jgi:hypothetical protein
MASSDSDFDGLGALVAVVVVVVIALMVIAATVTAGAVGGAGHAVLNYVRALRDNTSLERPGA